MAQINNPYKKDVRLSDFLTKWGNYHQKNADQVFGFLQTKPTLSYNPMEHAVRLILPPGASVYTEDPLLWTLLGFGTEQVRTFSQGSAPPLFGVRNHSRLPMHLKAKKQRLPGQEAEALLKVRRAELSLENFRPPHLRVTLVLDGNQNFETLGESEEGNLLEATSNLAVDLQAKMNLADDYLMVREDPTDGSVLLITKQEEGNRFLLMLTPLPETAETLGIERATWILHFGLGVGDEGSGLVAASAFLDSLKLTLDGGGDGGDGSGEGGGSNSGVLQEASEENEGEEPNLVKRS